MKNKVKPVKHYHNPDYPTKEQAIRDNAISVFPRRWKGNAAVAAVLALCVYSGMVGCSEEKDNNQIEKETTQKPISSQHTSKTDIHTVPTTIKSITTEGTRIRYAGVMPRTQRDTEEDVSSILRSGEKTQKPIDTTTTKSITTETPFVTYAGTSPYPKKTTEEDVSLILQRTEESK